MKYVAVLLLLVLCTSCIVQPVVYDPAGEETRVAAAVQATLGAPAGEGPPATAPPPPTPTPARLSPTPAPTPTPDVIFLPEDWTEYMSDDGTLTFWHPAAWEVEGTDPDGASFVGVNSFFYITVGSDDECGITAGTEGMAALDCLADSLLEAFGGANDADLRIVRKEVRRFGDRDGLVLEFDLQEGHFRAHAYLVAVTLEEDSLVAVLGVALDEQELEYLDLVAVSADVSGRDVDSRPPEERGEVSNPAAQAGTGDFGVTEWSWYVDRSGAYIHVDGIIENTSTRPIMYVRVFIATYDAEYNLLSTDSGYADLDYLRAGQSTTFKLVTPNPGGAEWVRIVTLNGYWAD